MCARIRWSRVLLSSALLGMSFAAACGARNALATRYDDLDRTSLVRGRACDVSDQDTTHFLHLPLYRACAVSIAARRVASEMQPEFRSSARDRNCFIALIEVAIDTLGRPEMGSARLIRESDTGYGASVLAILPGLRFEPARLGGRRVRQLYQLQEVLRVGRGRWSDGPRTRSVQTGSSGSVSAAPTGADLPTLNFVGAC